MGWVDQRSAYETAIVAKSHKIINKTKNRRLKAACEKWRQAKMMEEGILFPWQLCLLVSCCDLFSKLSFGRLCLLTSRLTSLCCLFESLMAILQSKWSYLFFTDGCLFVCIWITITLITMQFIFLYVISHFTLNIVLSITQYRCISFELLDCCFIC